MKPNRKNLRKKLHPGKEFFSISPRGIWIFSQVLDGEGKGLSLQAEFRWMEGRKLFGVLLRFGTKILFELREKRGGRGSYFIGEDKGQEFSFPIQNPHIFRLAPDGGMDHF
jgi:hypothetical protein